MPSPSDYLTMSAAAAILPGKPCNTTLWRWCRRGIKSRNGQVIRLDHVRMGNKLLTTREDLDRFAEELAVNDLDMFPDPTDDTDDVKADMKEPSPKRRTRVPNPPQRPKTRPTKRRKNRRSKTKAESNVVLDRIGI